MATSTESATPIFDANLVRTHSYSKALSKENRGKTLADVAAAEEAAMTFTIVLKKEPGSSFGVAIGSTQDETQHVIHSIKNKSVAAATGANGLMVNDVITKIGTDTLEDASRYNHAEMIRFLMENEVIVMEIQRPHPHYFNVELCRSRNDGKLGITIASISNDFGITVADVFGAAVGLLEHGDRLIACNGRLLRPMSHVEAEQFLGAHDHLTLTVERSSDVKDEFKKQITAIKSNSSLAGQISHLDGVVITRPSLDDGWGMKLAQAHDNTHFIQEHSHPGILVNNDIIVAVDGKNAQEYSHEQLVHYIQASIKLTLRIARSQAKILDPMCTDDLMSGGALSNVYTIKRSDESIPFGFTFGTRHTGGHVVRDVTPGGKADEGGMQPFDVILKINGIEVVSVEHDTVIELIKGENELEITYERGAETKNVHTEVEVITDSFGNVIPPPANDENDFVVQFKRDSSDQVIGCGLGTDATGRAFVTNVQSGSLAETAGLQNKDELIKIDDRSTRSVDHETLVKMITVPLECLLLVRRKHDDDFGPVVWQRPGLKDDREEINLTLHRDSESVSFGFGLGYTVSKRHFISGTSPKLDAFDVRVYDEIIKINGDDVTVLDHNQIVQKIQSGSGTTLNMVILRDTSFVADAKAAADDSFVDAVADIEGKDHFEVILKRDEAHASFGFGIGTTPDLLKVITTVSPEVEDNTNLQVHDFIEKVNGTDVTQMNHMECVALIQNSGLQVTLSMNRTYVKEEGVKRQKRLSIRQVDPALAKEVENTRTDSIA